ncbi:hypothetical protein MPTK1_7g04560 [Marchantia polymorpha subsp. ruderalis]|uniref:DUF7851 domain-containing protein n=2 Tax=Marchantia polymorpha TaxID=3197 RepID=A0AAF6BW46_MARPO|nr:hypothetical protein MARPO_0062s0070 [Marchantia polymorpha]BBN16230.1 hypothetical protein Mp_7g04560 [Marchantia polymorpha subsp. ruderalis]|eukprot:PTQ36652.1 hypothetical protein MARPO_0062s0070 [Marchantia polymorpha]
MAGVELKQGGMGEMGEMGELEFKSNQEVSGVDFGYQMVERWCTINRVPSPFGAQTLHFAPASTRHRSSQQKQKQQRLRFMCTMPQVGTRRSRRRRKHVIFFFDSDEVERLAERHFPPSVALKNIEDDMLRPLTDCEVARLKVAQRHATFYVYAVKWRGRAFERMPELCDLLLRLPTLLPDDDRFTFIPRPKPVSDKIVLAPRAPSQPIDSRSRAHLRPLPSEAETSKLLKISPKCRAL